MALLQVHGEPVTWFPDTSNSVAVTLATDNKQRMNDGRNPAQDQENNIQKHLVAKAFFDADGGWRKDEAKDHEKKLSASAVVMMRLVVMVPTLDDCTCRRFSGSVSVGRLASEGIFVPDASARRSGCSDRCRCHVFRHER